jgi:Zn-dependent peptidase ImmA (M78 family)
MHRPTISQIESGSRNVLAEELPRFADLYDVSVDWLLGRVDEEDAVVQLAARGLDKLKAGDRRETPCIAGKFARGCSMNRVDVARNAVSMALRVRQRAGLGLSVPVNPFDACASLNIEVRFANISSMEGMLARKPSLTIIVSSVRPSGRQAFTCAHELGHLVLDHQSTVDDVLDLMTEGEPAYQQDNVEEYAADQFAAFFLMPKTAVVAALRDRGLDPERCPPVHLLMLAVWFGVGFSTLAAHIRFSLNLISQGRYDVLRRLRPQDLRKQITGQDFPGLVVLDKAWRRPTVDVRAGDVVWVPESKVVSDLPQVAAAKSGVLLLVNRPGVFTVATPLHGTLQVRCMRQEFEGRSIYRYLAEEDDDDTTP